MQNIRLVITSSLLQDDLVAQIEEKIKKIGQPLRWAIVKVSSAKGKNKTFEVEATVLDKKDTSSMNIPRTHGDEVSLPEKPTFVHLVPTGIQAAIGGSLGDAMPVNVILSQLGNVVTHPNTCNGGPLLLADRRSLVYTEGYGIDSWAKNEVNLVETKSAKIGVVIDMGVNDRWVMDRTWNAVWGFHAHTGASIVAVEETKKPVGGVAMRNKSGAFVGEVKNLETVHDAVARLIKKGADRIAVFTSVSIENEYWPVYFQDKLPNPVGGTEAIISHSITRKFGIPAAHAPLIKPAEERIIQTNGRVRPAAALEAADPFYVWCVLRGLQDAPGFVHPQKNMHGLAFKKISALLCPATSMGGIPMMQAEKFGIPIIGIKQNTTLLQVSAKDLGYKNAIEVESYLIAIGILLQAKSTEDFSVKNLKKIAGLSKKQLEKLGRNFAISYGVEPRTLLRPLKALA